MDGVKKAYQLHSPVYVDGERWSDGKTFTGGPVQTSAGPPADLLSKHSWGSAETFPSFEAVSAFT